MAQSESAQHCETRNGHNTFDEQAKVDQLTEAVVALKDSVQLKIDQLKWQISQRDETIELLRLELARRADYKLLKERLARMQERKLAKSLSGEQADDATSNVPVDLSIRERKSYQNSAVGDWSLARNPINPMSQPTINRSVNQIDMEETASAHYFDTVKIACSVRDLLVTHGIGQRLFARHVLGLSQGTVSELLSKPKPWPKLTEKGRESYRKMANWAANADSVRALRRLLPTKRLLTKTLGSNGQRPLTPRNPQQQLPSSSNSSSNSSPTFAAAAGTGKESATIPPLTAVEDSLEFDCRTANSAELSHREDSRKFTPADKSRLQEAFIKLPLQPCSMQIDSLAEEEIGEQKHSTDQQVNLTDVISPAIDERKQQQQQPVQFSTSKRKSSKPMRLRIYSRDTTAADQ